MGAHSHIEQNPAFRAELDHQLDQNRHSIGRAIAADAARLAPGSIGHHIHHIPGEVTDQIVCDHPAWHFVEYGTPPHIIRSHGRWPLRDRHGHVFGRVVHHPGTQAQPFLRPAMYRSRTP